MTFTLNTAVMLKKKRFTAIEFQACFAKQNKGLPICAILNNLTFEENTLFQDFLRKYIKVKVVDSIQGYESNFLQLGFLCFINTNFDQSIILLSILIKQDVLIKSQGLLGIVENFFDREALYLCENLKNSVFVKCFESLRKLISSTGSKVTKR